MFLSLTNHSNVVSHVILLSFPHYSRIAVNLSQSSDVVRGCVCACGCGTRERACVRTCTRPSHKRWCQSCVCLSARVCTNERVGMLRSSRGRMLFPHPSLPIISRPDKTLVCWRLQDQTVMSRQLSSQHTADARWLSLS